MARNSRTWQSLLACSCLRRKPMCLYRTGSSFLSSSFSSRPNIAEHSAVNGSEVEQLMKIFFTQTSKTARFSFAKKVCTSSRVNAFNLSCVKEVQDFYGVLRKDVSNSSVDKIIDLLEHFVDAQDPFMNFLSTVLCKRVGELDFRSSLHLAELLTKLKLGDSSAVPIYNRLMTLFSEAICEDSWLGPQEIFRTITVLNNTRNFGSHLGLATADYLSRRLSTFDSEYASVLSAFIAKTTQFNKSKGHLLFDAVKSYILNILHQLPPTEKRQERWGKHYGTNLSNFMVFYGRVKLYENDIVNVMKELLYGPLDSEIHSPRFISRFLSMCTKIQYYDQELFDHIIKVSLTKLEDFPCVELGIMLYSFAHLNHEHRLFLDRVIMVAEQNFQSTMTHYNLDWAIMKSCLFMNHYHPAVLERFLSDEVLQVSRAERPLKLDVLYLRLLIGLVVENPESGYRNYSRADFFNYPFHIKGVSKDHAHSSLSCHLSMYKSIVCSIFSSNFKRALKSIISPNFFSSEVITLGGYIIDFEVLLGANNKLFEFPYVLRYRPYMDGLRSIGAVARSKSDRDLSNIKSNTVPPLISALKECERDGKGSGDLHLPEMKVTGSRRSHVVNFASDWTKYLLHGRAQPLPHRKIAFELNGPSHYAVNDPRHMMGKDIVKKRQLQALGWKVIDVPYFEWEELKTGDDHIYYVTCKLRENYYINM